jgi:Tfp pilus assembly protein PilF
MRLLVVSLLLLLWLAGCIVVPAGGPVVVPPGGQVACPPGHNPVLHPSDAAALRNHIKHGYKSLSKGDCESALEEFQQALEIAPYEPEAQAGWQEAQDCLHRGHHR